MGKPGLEARVRPQWKATSAKTAGWFVHVNVLGDIPFIGENTPTYLLHGNAQLTHSW